MENLNQHYKIEKDDDWEGWCEKIPYIPFKKDWEVKVIPPFGGLQARFWVRLRGDDDRNVSVYLDCYERSGFFDQPYWEVYPYMDDIGRCAMNDVDQLIEMIEFTIIEKHPVPWYRKWRKIINWFFIN